MKTASQKLGEKRTARSIKKAAKPRKKAYFTKRDILCAQAKAAQTK